MTTAEIAKNVLTELLGHSLKTIAGSLETSPTHQNRGIRILDKYANARCIELVKEISQLIDSFDSDFDAGEASSHRINLCIKEIAKKYTNKPR